MGVAGVDFTPSGSSSSQAVRAAPPDLDPNADKARKAMAAMMRREELDI
jgi:hypothetical protein